MQTPQTAPKVTTIRNCSRIGELLRERVASQPYVGQQHPQYMEYAIRKKIFTKPTQEFVKQSDNLSRNGAILRRGQFEIPSVRPLKTSSTVALPPRNHSSCKFEPTPKKSVRLLTQNPEEGKRQFRASMVDCKMEYGRLLKGERWMKYEQIKVRNCMNRILGQEIVRYHLLSSRYGCK